MVSQTLTYSVAQTGLRTYQTNAVGQASPAELLLKVYDAAVVSCRQQDRDRASRALVELINSLNFDHKDISIGLFRLYSYCLQLVKSDRFEEPERILSELRDTWAQALGLPGYR